MSAAPVIAIDGPAASGKGTIARALARHFGFAYLDTGRLYRAVAYRLLEAEIPPDHAELATDAAQTLDLSAIGDPALGSREVGAAASQVASITPVRDALLDLQRQFATHPPGRAKGAVLDGRDIGTTICPGAAVKIFVTASMEQRAERRRAELATRGQDVSLAEMIADLSERDLRDQTRGAAPLRPADDAVLLDTSELDIDSAVAAAVAIAEGVLGRPA